MYAIQNALTGEFLYGTDYRYNPPHQRTSTKDMKTYGSLYSAQIDFKCRRCNKNYQIVEISVVVNNVIEHTGNEFIPAISTYEK